MTIGIVQISSSDTKRQDLLLDKIIPRCIDITERRYTLVSSFNKSLYERVIGLGGTFVEYTAWEKDMSHSFRCPLSTWGVYTPSWRSAKAAAVPTPRHGTNSACNVRCHHRRQEDRDSKTPGLAAHRSCLRERHWQHTSDQEVPLSQLYTPLAVGGSRQYGLPTVAGHLKTDLA